MEKILPIITIALYIIMGTGGSLCAEPVDSTDIVPDSTTLQSDTASITADSIEVRPPINYMAIPDYDTICRNYLHPYKIENSISSVRIPNSVRDAVIPYSGFYSLKSGPYGQTSVIVRDGLPVNKYILGDFLFDYRQLKLPVNGLIDSRLMSLGGAETLRYSRMAYARDWNAVSLFRPSPIDSGALTSVYMQKGDYGFSNTKVRFAAAPGSRTRIGFSAGFKMSNSYYENAKKDLENYSLYTIYQLSDNFQIQQDLVFFTGNDQLRFENSGFDYRGESESSFIGFSMALAASDSVALFRRMAFIYQRYHESVRNGDHPKYRQLSELYKFKIDNNINWKSFDNRITVEPYMKRITFDPGRESYPGIRLSDFSSLRLLPSSSIYFSAATDLNKQSDADMSLTFGINHDISQNISVGAQVYRISENPSDYNLFARSGGLTRTEVASVDYYFEGDDDLGNTDHYGLRLCTKINFLGMDAEAYARQEKIEDYHWWQEWEPTDSTYGARIVPTEMELLASGIDLTVMLPLDLNTRLSYSYSRLQDSDNDQYLTMSPRHNVYASVIRNLYISRFDLHVLLNVEGEYHSANYNNNYIPLELDENVFLNFKLHLKIKSLTFYYNMDNVLGESYLINDGYELGRGVWWGFLWNFIN